MKKSALVFELCCFKDTQSYSLAEIVNCPLNTQKSRQKCPLLPKDCVCEVFANLFCKSKGEHF